MSAKDIAELQNDLSSEFNYHRCSLNDICKKLHTNQEEGLTEVEAKNRLDNCGLNDIEQPKNVSVLRDKIVKSINAQFLVPGDIVHLIKGDHIAADMRIIAAENFTVNISALTGENSAQKRSPERTSENPLETENMLYFPSLVKQGNAKAVVILTGKKRVMHDVVKLGTKI